MKLRSLAAVALLAPAVAFAAGASGGKSKTTSSSSSSQTSATAGTALEGLSVGGFVGYESGDLSGLSLRLDGELPFRQLSPQINMSFVGSIGYSHLTWEPFSYWKLTANTFKFVPAARFTMPLNEQFSVFGDAGLGLAYISMTAKYSNPFGFGSAEYTGSSTNLMMRLGVGAWYQMNPQLRLGALLEYDPVFGDYGYAANGVGGTQNTLLVQVGAMYRL